MNCIICNIFIDTHERGKGTKKYCESCKVKIKILKKQEYYKKHIVKTCIYCNNILIRGSYKFCNKKCMIREQRITRMMLRYKRILDARDAARKRIKNPEYYREYKRLWRLRNKDKIRKYDREYYIKTYKQDMLNT